MHSNREEYKVVPRNLVTHLPRLPRDKMPQTVTGLNRLTERWLPNEPKVFLLESVRIIHQRKSNASGEVSAALLCVFTGIMRRLQVGTPAFWRGKLNAADSLTPIKIGPVNAREIMSIQLRASFQFYITISQLFWRRVTCVTQNEDHPLHRQWPQFCISRCS